MKKYDDDSSVAACVVSVVNCIVPCSVHPGQMSWTQAQLIATLVMHMKFISHRAGAGHINRITTTQPRHNAMGCDPPRRLAFLILPEIQLQMAIIHPVSCTVLVGLTQKPLVYDHVMRNTISSTQGSIPIS